MRRRQFGLVAVGAPPRVGELAGATIFMEGVSIMRHGRRREARRRLLHSSRAAEAQGRHEVVGCCRSGVGGGLGTGVVRIKDEVVSSRKRCGDEALPGAAHGPFGRPPYDWGSRRTHAARRTAARHKAGRLPGAIYRCALWSSRQPVSGGGRWRAFELAPRRPLFIGRVVLGRLEMRSLLRGGANTHSTFY